MKKEKHSYMNFRLSTLYYTGFFTGMGIFSFLLLANYTDLTERITTTLPSVKALFFFIAAFNVLGYSTMKISSWIDNQYALNIYHRWKFGLIYMLVILMLLALNYGLLIMAKILMEVPHPFTFPNGGWRILIATWLIQLVVLGLLLANRSMQYTLKLQQKAAELQKENNIARYTALQNQLNPHFLFNSLNTLISEIRYDPKNAELFTQHLSDVYRYTLQCQEKQLATLSEELDFLTSYIFLHQVRLGDCIHINNQIPASYYDKKVPPLTLQLLAENVIKHNTIHINKPMTIELSCPTEGNELIIKNPTSPKMSVTSSKVGLKNLSSRYRLLCNHNIDIDNTDNYFTVKIPLIHE